MSARGAPSRSPAWGLLLGLSGIFVALLALVFVGQRVAARGRYALPYSALGAGPEGSRGLFLLSERLGASPTRWAEDLGHLPAPEEGPLLVALGGCGSLRRPLSRLERESLMRWIEGGGVLLVAGARGYLPPALGLGLEGGCEADSAFDTLVGEDGQEGVEGSPPEGAQLSPEDVAARLREAQAAAEAEERPRPPRIAAPAPGALLSLRYDLSLREPAQLTLPPPEEGRPIGEPEPLMVLLDDGAPAALTRRVGEGRVIALASASAFTNADLGTHEGGVFFAHLRRAYAPDARVIFDEYHLGAGAHRSLLRYLRQLGLGPLIVQLLIVLALALWPAMRRFGGPLQPAEEEAGGTASYVSALGALYRQAKDRTGTAALMARRALKKAAAHHHLPGLTPAALANLLRRRGRVEAAEAIAQLAAHLEDGAGSPPRDMVQVAAQVDAALARATADDPPRPPSPSPSPSHAEDDA